MTPGTVDRRLPITEEAARWLTEFGVYLLAIGLVAGLATAFLGPLPAFVGGAVLLVAATIRAATRSPT